MGQLLCLRMVSMRLSKMSRRLPCTVGSVLSADLDDLPKGELSGEQSIKH